MHRPWTLYARTTFARRAPINLATRGVAVPSRLRQHVERLKSEADAPRARGNMFGTAQTIAPDEGLMFGMTDDENSRERRTELSVVVVVAIAFAVAVGLVRAWPSW